MILRALVLVWSLSFWGALAENRNSTESYGLRLADGVSRCRGQLQVQRSGQDWTGVDPWGGVPQWLGHRVCAELDCGPPLFVKDITVSNRDAVGLSPFDCKDLSLIHCFESDTSLSDRALELRCSDSVRLVSGRSLCSGSLQIRDQSLGQSWTSVCEGALGRRGAEVLCRELGCGAPLLQGELSPLGQTFHCEGHESALMDCPRNQTRTDPETCSALHLTCSDPVRLVGGANRCEGMVEVKHRGLWRQVGSDPYPGDTWDLEAAAVVCRGLDCGSAVSIELRKQSESNEAWMIRPVCVKERAVLKDCAWSWRLADQKLEVVCSGKSESLLRAPALAPRKATPNAKLSSTTEAKANANISPDCPRTSKGFDF